MPGTYTDVEPPIIESITIERRDDEIEFRYDVSDAQSGLSEVGHFLHRGDRIVSLSRTAVDGHRERGTLLGKTGSQPNRYRFYVADAQHNRTYATGDLEEAP